MKRRDFLRSVQAGVIVSVGAAIVRKLPMQPATAATPLSIQWLGHTCFRFSGGGQTVLVNPFRPLGCTANYRAPQVSTDLVLISSRLLDEGVVEGLPGRPRLLFEPGTYRTNGLEFQGIRTLHDRQNGFRFGVNVAWKWTQAGINLLHLGGIAAPITIEQRILMGQPDVLLIPVGGSAKAYTPEEAKAAVDSLQPKIVIPTHYLTAAANPDACDLQPVDDFLALMQGATIRSAGSDSLSVTAGSLPSAGPVVEVMTYRF
ncbi:Zn-dependent hydrolase [Synechococcales cyanobacterium C]|uniref:Zn-dependent hydrolase n=1 Tax=Petrachloros mirabilis ULC683 TaxID=2781853 RepID=A0A8K2A0U6_9CYAN|nr:MBL fold metallo-hydrolase [Petrachloros mirabilis]NCJ07681.1 Zn-dependent hydrolase [Petrachloros mirabilis ULC683]